MSHGMYLYYLGLFVPKCCSSVIMSPSTCGLEVLYFWGVYPSIHMDLVTAILPECMKSIHSNWMKVLTVILQ